MPGIY